MRAFLLRPRARPERGAEIVELALVLPVFLLVLAFVVDAGFMLNNYNVVTNAAREGARVAAIPGWIEDDVRARVNAYIAAAGLPTASVVTSVEPVAVTVGTRSINAVRVMVSYRYMYLMLAPIMETFQGGAAPPSLTLTAAATMRTEVVAGL